MKPVRGDQPETVAVSAHPTRRELRREQAKPGRRVRRRYLRALVSALVVLPALWFGLASASVDSGYASTSVNRLGSVDPLTSSVAKVGLSRAYRAPGDGVVTGVKFKMVNAGPATYLVSVWSPEGVLLGWAATGETVSDGWRTAQFTTPVTTKGGTTYTLIYWASPQKLARNAVRDSNVQVLWTPKAAPPRALPGPTVPPSATPTPSGSSSPPKSTQPADRTPPTLTSFPNASNTGVPAGTTLKPSGSLTISKAGTVIDGLDVNGVIDVVASNVTIKNTRVRGVGWWSIQVSENVSGVVIQDSDIDGRGTSGAENSMGVMGPATVLRCDIRGVENGLTPGSGSLLQDNYVHDLGAPGAAHYDGIQIDGSRSNIMIRHNTVLNQFGQTSAVMVDNYFGPISNITVDGNYLGGGGYTVYSDGQFSGGSITGVRFTNNRMVRGTYGYASVNRNTIVDTGNVDAVSTTTVDVSN